MAKEKIQKRKAIRVFAKKLLQVDEKFRFETVLLPSNCFERLKILKQDDYYTGNRANFCWTVKVIQVDNECYDFDIRSMLGVENRPGFHFVIVKALGHIDKDYTSGLTILQGKVIIGKEYFLLTLLTGLAYSVSIIALLIVHAFPAIFILLLTPVAIGGFLLMWRSMFIDRQRILRSHLKSQFAA